MRSLVVHPPASIARDFIDYPYFSDLGAVQLAAVLTARGFENDLVDAYALAGSGLAWRDDGRAHLGASVAEVRSTVQGLVRMRGAFDLVVVAYTSFHRPPARDDVLGALLAGLRDDLLLEHRLWLGGFGYEEADMVEEDPERLAGLIGEETGRQILHNIDVGLIEIAESEETVRYSWRGLFYLYLQLVKDMVRKPMAG